MNPDQMPVEAGCDHRCDECTAVHEAQSEEIAVLATENGELLRENDHMRDVVNFARLIAKSEWSREGAIKRARELIALLDGKK